MGKYLWRRPEILAVGILDMLLYQVLIVATKIRKPSRWGASPRWRELLYEVIHNLGGGKKHRFLRRERSSCGEFLSHACLQSYFTATVYPRQTLDFVYRYGGTQHGSNTTRWPAIFKPCNRSTLQEYFHSQKERDVLSFRWPG